MVGKHLSGRVPGPVLQIIKDLPVPKRKFSHYISYLLLIYMYILYHAGLLQKVYEFPF